MMNKRKKLNGLLYPVFCFIALTVALPAYGADDLNKQIDVLVDQLTTSLKGEVVKGSETEVYINLGQKQGVIQGNRFEIIRRGEPLKIGEEIIGYEETPVAQVEVKRARDKMSICSVLEKTDVPQAGDRAYEMRRQIKRLVIGQFSYNQGFNRFTKSLQEKLFTTIANRGMQVVERDQLERVLKEQKLGYSGLINTDSAKKIGQLLGAEGMLLGTVNDMGDAITINARLVDLESGNTITAAEVELPKTPLIVQLLGMPVEDKPFITQSGSSSKPKKSAGKAQQTEKAKGFTFALQGCEKKSENITCHLLITSEDKDKFLLLSKNLSRHVSRIFTASGEEYSASQVRLGNCVTPKEYCDKILIAGVPTKAHVTFEGVGQNAQSIAALEVSCNLGSWRKKEDWFVAQFRNIPLSQ